MENTIIHHYYIIETQREYTASPNVEISLQTKGNNQGHIVGIAIDAVWLLNTYIVTNNIIKWNTGMEMVLIH